jgi:hypothetical protein
MLQSSLRLSPQAKPASAPRLVNRKTLRQIINHG